MISLTLAKRTGRDLDTLSYAKLGMTRGNGIDLSKRFKVVHGHLVTRKMEHDVLQCTASLRVSTGEGSDVAAAYA